MLVNWEHPVEIEAVTIIEDYFKRNAEFLADEGVYQTDFFVYDVIFLYSLCLYLKKKYGIAPKNKKIVGKYKTSYEKDTFCQFINDDELMQHFKELFETEFGYLCYYTVEKFMGFITKFIDFKSLDCLKKQDSLVIYGSPKEHNQRLIQNLLGQDAYIDYDCTENNILEYLYYSDSHEQSAFTEYAEKILLQYLEIKDNDDTDYESYFSETFRRIDFREAEQLIQNLALSKPRAIDYLASRGIEILPRQTEEEARKAAKALMQFMEGDFLFYTNAKSLNEPYADMEEYCGDDLDGEVYTVLNVLFIGISPKYIVSIGETLLASHE